MQAEGTVPHQPITQPITCTTLTKLYSHLEALNPTDLGQNASNEQLHDVKGAWVASKRENGMQMQVEDLSPLAFTPHDLHNPAKLAQSTCKESWVFGKEVVAG